MHIFFSGIGGSGISPLAMLAHQAGHTISGSDLQSSAYIKNLQKNGITDIHIGQSRDAIAAVHDKNPIDWFVYTSSLPMEQPNSPEMAFCREMSIKMSHRDELTNQIIQDNKLDLIAVAGTHGKTTSTAMTVWLLKQLGIPESHLLPAKSDFTDMGLFDPASKYFVYECDEFDRNFLSFTPQIAMITGVDWDHPDIYPTRDDYNAAFRDFIQQCDQVTIWQSDAERLDLESSDNYLILDNDTADLQLSKLAGLVNRQNAVLVANALSEVCSKTVSELITILNAFPGVSRRFEQIVENLYSDYAHTPPKIRGALQLAHEVAGNDVVVVYEGLHNTRQHFIKDELPSLFEGVKKLYIVPSYLAREDPNLKLLTPDDLKLLLNGPTQSVTDIAELNDDLSVKIRHHMENGDTVICLSAGGHGSLDEWVRNEFSTK